MTISEIVQASLISQGHQVKNFHYPDLDPWIDPKREESRFMDGYPDIVGLDGMQLLCGTLNESFSRKILESDTAMADFKRNLTLLAQRINRRSGEAISAGYFFDAPAGLEPDLVSRLVRHLSPNEDIQIFVRKPGEIDFEERVPTLTPLIPVCSSDAGQRMHGFELKGDTRVPDIAINFDDAGPGLVILSGKNSTGKSRFVEGVVRAGFFSSEPRPNIEPELMCLYRRAVGYGRPDGSLLMPLAYEGRGVQVCEAAGFRLLSSMAGSEGRSGLVLDDAFRSVDNSCRAAILELVVRYAANHQVLLTERDHGWANFTHMLAKAHNVPCGWGDLDRKPGASIEVSVSPRRPDFDSKFDTGNQPKI